MEGCRGDLEAQSDKHQRRGNVRQNRYVAGAEYVADGVDVGGTGSAEHERDPVEKERGGE